MLVPYNKFLTIAWLLLLAALLNVQCGYRLSGRGRNLPAGAQTIAIPPFKNETAEYQAERFVTAAIREEFIARSSLLLSESPEKADMALTGTISAFATIPIPDSDRGAARRYEVRITIDMHLIDMKKNETFYEANGLVFRETYEAVAGDFFSLDAGSMAKIAAKFAAAAVTAMLANF